MQWGKTVISYSPNILRLFVFCLLCLLVCLLCLFFVAFACLFVVFVFCCICLFLCCVFFVAFVWQCGMSKKHLRIVELAASIFSPCRFPIVCTHCPTLPMPYSVSLFFCLLLLLVKGAVVSLLIRWTSLCGSSASVLKVYVNNSLLNYLFCSPKLFVELLLEMCIPMHDCYVHESTNISSQCCIITINLLNWITTVLA